MKIVGKIFNERKCKIKENSKWKYCKWKKKENERKRQLKENGKSKKVVSEKVW